MHRSHFTRKQYILPAEHGAWIWLLGPLIAGAAAGGRPGPAFVWVALAALAAYMIRQPLTIVVKVLAGRRPAAQLPPALAWTFVYLVVLSLALGGLMAAGQARLLGLAVVAAPVFVWHLWLVSRRAERRRPGVEIGAAGVLALGAPAAYWTSQGTSGGVAWTLWLLMWLQSASSIVQVHYRLSGRWNQENLERLSPWRVLGYHAVAVLAAAVAVLFGLTPPMTAVAFALPLLDGLVVSAHPDPQAAPRTIGYRQLGVSSIFVVLIALGYTLW